MTNRQKKPRQTQSKCGKIAILNNSTHTHKDKDMGRTFIKITGQDVVRSLRRYISTYVSYRDTAGTPTLSRVQSYAAGHVILENNRRLPLSSLTGMSNGHRG